METPTPAAEGTGGGGPALLLASQRRAVDVWRLGVSSCSFEEDRQEQQHAGLLARIEQIPVTAQNPVEIGEHCSKLSQSDVASAESLLLERGDWVPYRKGRTVKINVMDRDAQGVKALVIKRGDSVVENVEVREKGVIERAFSVCGDYTAHCVMSDGSASQACEFSVCDLDCETPNKPVTLGKPWEIAFSSENMDVIIIYLYSRGNGYNHRAVFVTEQDRRNGKVTIPAGLLENAGKWQIWLIGENRYGRLKRRRGIAAVEREN